VLRQKWYSKDHRVYQSAFAGVSEISDSRPSAHAQSDIQGHAFRKW